MVCVYACCTVKLDKIEEHNKIAQILVEKTRQEDGNLSYDYGQVLDTENKFSFVERWKSMEDFEAHLEMPHYKELKPLMSACREGKSDVFKMVTI